MLSAYLANASNSSMADASAAIFPLVFKIHPQCPLNRTSNEALTMVPPAVSSNFTMLLIKVNLVSPSDSTLAGVMSRKSLDARLPDAVVMPMVTRPPWFLFTVTVFIRFDHFGMDSKSVYAA